MKTLKTFISYFLSFFKTEWTFQDYPLEIHEQTFEPKYIARISKWPQLDGLGSTKLEAISNLQANFNNYREVKPLPRPGTKVPLEFASTLEFQKLVAKYPEALPEFFDSIIGISLMKKLVLFIFLSSSISHAETIGMCESMYEARSKELQEIVNADQEARRKKPVPTDMTARDLKRRMRVGEIFGEGCLKSAADFAAAALVYQHGMVPEHFFQTFLWAKRAVELGDEKWIDELNKRSSCKAAKECDTDLKPTPQGSVPGFW